MGYSNHNNVSGYYCDYAPPYSYQNTTCYNYTNTNECEEEYHIDNSVCYANQARVDYTTYTNYWAWDDHANIDHCDEDFCDQDHYDASPYNDCPWYEIQNCEDHSNGYYYSEEDFYWNHEDECTPDIYYNCNAPGYIDTDHGDTDFCDNDFCDVPHSDFDDTAFTENWSDHHNVCFIDFCNHEDTFT